MQNLSIDINTPHNNFTLLRIIAASLVLYSHSYALLKLGDREPFFSLTGGVDFGNFAVSIFFVISGFLVTASLLRSKSILNYLKNRSLRIFPGLITAVLLSIFVLGPCMTTLSLSEYFSSTITWHYLKNIYLLNLQYHLPGVFEQNLWGNAVNGSLWTLPIEFAAYILLIILYLLRMCRVAYLLIVLAILEVFHLKLLTQLHWEQFSYFSVALVYAIPFWYFFFAGVLIYLVRDKLTFNYLFFVCAVALWIASFRTPSFHAYHILLVPYMVIFLVYMPFPFSQWIEKYIGDISYGIYVYAFPVQQTLVSLTKGQIDFLLFNALSLMITIILATLSWRFVEKPALKLKRLSLWKTTHQTSISS